MTASQPSLRGSAPSLPVPEILKNLSIFCHWHAIFHSPKDVRPVQRRIAVSWLCDGRKGPTGLSLWPASGILPRSQRNRFRCPLKHHMTSLRLLTVLTKF